MRLRTTEYEDFGKGVNMLTRIFRPLRRRILLGRRRAFANDRTTLCEHEPDAERYRPAP